MIQRRRSRSNVEVTFSLDHDDPVSVVGDFNGWDPHAHPLVHDGNSERVVKVVLRPGSYAFRYSADGARFFNDPNADSYVDNGAGDTHGVLDIEEPASAPKKVWSAPPARKPRISRTKKATSQPKTQRTDDKRAPSGDMP